MARTEYIIEDGKLFCVEHEKGYVFEVNHTVTVEEFLTWIDKEER